MRRFNIAPRWACVQCQQWHWPPCGKVCMCVSGYVCVCVVCRLGVRKPTAQKKLPHRCSYLPVSGPTWEVWHQWNYTDSGTEGTREKEKKRVCLWKWERGGAEEKRRGWKKQLWGEKVYLEGINLVRAGEGEETENKGQKNGNRYKWGYDSQNKWWRDWKERKGDLNMQTVRVWLER